MLTKEETKECPFCGKAIPIDPIFCRYCRKDLVGTTATGPLPPEILLTGSTLLLVALMGTSALWMRRLVPSADDMPVQAVAATVPGNVAPDGTIALGAGDLQRLEKGKLGTPVLTGTVTNTSKYPLTSLTAEAEFYDKEGKRVTTGLDETSNTVAPGEAWRFEVQWPDDIRIDNGKIVRARGKR